MKLLRRPISASDRILDRFCVISMEFLSLSRGRFSSRNVPQRRWAKRTVCRLQAKAACKRTQQLRTLLRQQCWELLRAYWQWYANGCNNSQQCWDLKCIVGRTQPISLCKPCVLSVLGPNNVGRAVQTIQHCCATLRWSRNKRNGGSSWPESLTGFKLFATTSNNMQQGVQTDATCNIQQCW